MTKYEVTGSSPFRGYQPGETFEADLDPFIEQWAIDNGHLKPVSKPKGKEKDGG